MALSSLVINSIGEEAAVPLTVAGTLLTRRSTILKTDSRENEGSRVVVVRGFFAPILSVEEFHFDRFVRKQDGFWSSAVCPLFLV